VPAKNQCLITIEKLSRYNIPDAIVVETLLAKSMIAMDRHDDETSVRVGLQLISKTDRNPQNGEPTPWHSAHFSVAEAYFNLRCPEKAYQHLNIIAEALEEQKLSEDTPHRAERLVKLKATVDEAITLAADPTAEEEYDFRSTRVCAHCGFCGVDLQLCSGCEWTNYCFADCQKAAWIQHKDFCHQHSVKK
jgi:hypothetical protein